MRRPFRRFLFRLCLALGVIHPDHLQRLLTARQILDWEVYSELEPFGYVQEQVRFGELCAAVANFSQISRKRNHGWRDFMPYHVDMIKRATQTLGDRIITLFGGKKPERRR